MVKAVVYEIEITPGSRTRVSKSIFFDWCGRRWKNGRSYHGRHSDKPYTTPDHTAKGPHRYKIECTKGPTGQVEYDLRRNGKLVATKATLPQIRRVMKFLKRRDYQKGVLGASHSH